MFSKVLKILFLVIYIINISINYLALLLIEIEVVKCILVDLKLRR